MRSISSVTVLALTVLGLTLRLSGIGGLDFWYDEIVLRHYSLTGSALYTPTDLIIHEPLVDESLKKLAAGGAQVERGTLTGPAGHVNGVTGVGQAADKIRAFLGN